MTRTPSPAQFFLRTMISRKVNIFLVDTRKGGENGKEKKRQAKAASLTHGSLKEGGPLTESSLKEGAFDASQGTAPQADSSEPQA